MQWPCICHLNRTMLSASKEKNANILFMTGDCCISRLSPVCCATTIFSALLKHWCSWSTKIIKKVAMGSKTWMWWSISVRKLPQHSHEKPSPTCLRVLPLSTVPQPTAHLQLWPKVTLLCCVRPRAENCLKWHENYQGLISRHINSSLLSLVDESRIITRLSQGKCALAIKNISLQLDM